jgi:cell division protein FtsW
MQFKAEQVGAPEGMARATLLVPLLVLLLVTFGLIALFSAGYSMSLREPTAAVARQLVYTPLAFLAGWLAWRVNLDRVRDLRWPFLWLVILLLVLARTPGIGRMVNGSWRWIDFGLFRLQPSDLAKIALVLLVADHIARWQRRSLPIREPFLSFSSRPPYLFTAARWADLRDGFLRPMLPLLLLCGGIALGPDLGTIVLCGAVAFAMLFVGGARMSYLAAAFALAAGAFTFLVLNWGSRLRRFLSFLDPEGRQGDESYQLFQGMLAFAVGGISGAGPGNGLQQRAYLPEAHTDFVFTIIGEEWGLGATVFVAGIYLWVFRLVASELRACTDLFRMSLALGCVLFLTLQALVNMCVVTGLLPTKGISLPFISYGGTNLVTSAVLIGLMLNALRDGGRPTLRPAVIPASAP